MSESMRECVREGGSVWNNEDGNKLENDIGSIKEERFRALKTGRSNENSEMEANHGYSKCSSL